MKKVLIILFSFIYLLCYSQVDPGPHKGYIPIKGEAFFLRDAQGRIISTESGGILAILGGVDTASSVLVPPPDTIQSFTATGIDSIGGGFTSLKSEIRSYWTLEEAAGNAVDSVGTADLPVSGSVTREQAGKIDNCYSFANPSYLGPIDTYFEFDGSFTISCWFSTTSATAWDAIISNFGATNYGWELLSVGNPIRVLYWRMRYSGGNETIEGTTDINDGAWYHIAASYSAVDDTMKLWIDGVLEGSTENTNGTWYNSEARFHIGSRLAGAYFEGKIDEPATWNRELTHAEINALAGEDQYPFTESGGGDSLRIQMIDFDERADSVRIITNPLGEGRSSSRTDGTLLLAFNMADSADYNDTTILWSLLTDTTYIIEAYTGLWPEDIWTAVPNRDTALIDSSDISPPPQDIGIWDTIYYNDFEQHTGAPMYYDRATFLNEWRPIERYASRDEYRASDYRSPAWYNDNLKDSIVIDETTGSKVMQMLFAEGIHEGADGQSGRGGDFWRHIIDGSPRTEIYVSSNIILRPGFDWSAGGKICWGIGGGSNPGTGSTRPGYGDGFMGVVIWGWRGDTYGCPSFYMFHQDQPHDYGEMWPFGEFQPEGENLTGQYNSSGNWEWPTADSTWINITVRCVTNTHTGATFNRDGIFEAFINGRLVGQWGGMYLITYPDIGNEIWLLNWYQSFGGGGPPLRNEWIWNDDVWVFTYDVSVDVPRGNELSPPGRVLSLPNYPKPLPPE